LLSDLNVLFRDEKIMIKKTELFQDVDRVFSLENTVAKN